MKQGIYDSYLAQERRKFFTLTMSFMVILLVLVSVYYFVPSLSPRIYTVCVASYVIIICMLVILLYRISVICRSSYLERKRKLYEEEVYRLKEYSSVLRQLAIVESQYGMVFSSVAREIAYNARSDAYMKNKSYELGQLLPCIKDESRKLDEEYSSLSEELFVSLAEQKTHGFIGDIPISKSLREIKRLERTRRAIKENVHYIQDSLGILMDFLALFREYPSCISVIEHLVCMSTRKNVKFFLRSYHIMDMFFIYRRQLRVFDFEAHVDQRIESIQLHICAINNDLSDMRYQPFSWFSYLLTGHV